ncbi:MAG: peptidase S1, partial [Candidatus Saccharimonas sp.]|nr:peptidase S1 [Planctomycetaceae bacterium]
LKIDADSSLGHRLEPNDVLEAVGRKPVASLDDLKQALAETASRDSVVLHVHRATDADSREQLVVWRRPQ